MSNIINVLVSNEELLIYSVRDWRDENERQHWREKKEKEAKK